MMSKFALRWSMVAMLLASVAMAIAIVAYQNLADRYTVAKAMADKLTMDNRLRKIEEAQYEFGRRQLAALQNTQRLEMLCTALLHHPCIEITEPAPTVHAKALP